MRRRGFLGLIIATGFGAATEGCVTISPIAATGDFPVATGVQLGNSTTFLQMAARANGRGQIVIGVKDDQPGLGYLDPKTHAYTGFDIEIAELVAAGLGFRRDQILFVAVQSVNRENAIQNNSVDLVIASYSYTADRENLISFAGPYFKTTEGLLVRSDAGVSGLSTLTASNRVCSAINSTSYDELPQLTSARPIAKQSYSECVKALSDHAVDGVYTDVAVLAGYAAQAPQHLKILEGNGSRPQLYGIGLPKGDPALQGKINDILRTAEQNGTWQAIFNATLAPSGITASAPPVGSWTA
jgi:glutamate transport system substrate-binding protein